MTTPTERAESALWGLAIGDALGMPTQLMSRSEVERRFGTITTFEPAAADHPIAAGLPAGSITDDTEQAILLARHLLAHGGHVDAAAFARELVAWEDDMRARGSLDLLGPSTKAAVAAILAGTPVEDAGRFGTTNGAAMRVTPVGLSTPSADVPGLVDRVVEASKVTHNTGVALAGASAVAAAVSAGIDGASLAEAFGVAIEAARLGAIRGRWVAAADVARRIEWAIGLADPADAYGSVRTLYELIGTSLATQESVPAAFGLLATHPDDPWTACLAAASLGGDSDTIAAMAGAIGGACVGTAAFPADAIDTVRRVNRLDLETLARDLLALR
ncbi:MAG: ADP-ribosylglycohydrolase [Leifsonia sp.]|nr:ADP-ribosylglycohydrolase [Leifsonia sp.]